MDPFGEGWYSSQNSEYNPEMYPPPNYPINFSSQSFDSTAYGDSSSLQHNASDGQSEDDGEEENRGRRLTWTEEDNIRLVSILMHYFIYISCFLYETCMSIIFFHRRLAHG